MAHVVQWPQQVRFLLRNTICSYSLQQHSPSGTCLAVKAPACEVQSCPPQHISPWRSWLNLTTHFHNDARLLFLIHQHSSHTLRSKNRLKVFYFQKENPLLAKYWCIFTELSWSTDIYMNSLLRNYYRGPVLKRELYNTNEVVRKDNEYQSLLWYQNDVRSYSLKCELLTWLHLSFTRNKCVSDSH